VTAAEIQETLRLSAAEVVETMFFAELLGEAPAREDGLTAKLGFHGGPSGVFTVEVSGCAARSLAAAFLALDEAEVSGEHAAEVVCELANMICGSALSRLEPDATFDLDHPVVVPSGAAEPGAVVRSFDLGDGVLSLSLAIEPAP